MNHPIRPKTPLRIVTWLIVLAMLTVGMATQVAADLAPVYGKVAEKPTSSTDPAMVIYDTTITAATTGTSSGIGFWDCDSDGVDSTDPWYVDVNADGDVDVNEIRITSVPSTECTSSYSSGTLVQSSDGDRGKTLTRTGFAVCFVDTVTTASNVYNPTETVYISHEDTDCTDGLIVNNIYLHSTSGGSAGSRVTTADAVDGLALGSIDIEVYDVDNDGSFSKNDGVYIDLPYNGNAGFGSPGDIRLLSATSEGFGSVVEKDDTEIVYRLVDLGYEVRRETADAANCDGSTAPSIYLSAGATVAADDIRLTQTGSFSVGSIVKTGDSDIGVATTAITGSVDRVDQNDNNDIFDTDDFIWYDSNGDNDVDTGEVRLSKSGSLSAGACVGSSDADRGLSSDGAITTALVKYFDTDRSGGFNSGDLVYLDMDDGVAGDGGDGYVSVGDIKWSTSTQLSGIAFGDIADSDDQDVTYVLDLVTGQGAGIFCFQDGTGSGTYQRGEPVYLRLSSTTGCGAGVALAAGDLRLTSSGTSAAGTFVGGGSGDTGDTVPAIGGTPAFMFYNIGSDLTTMQKEDVLYLDADGSGKVTVGDVIITGASSHGSAGQVVSSSDSSILNGDLVAFTAGTCGTINNYCIRGFDMDGDRSFSTNDEVVWDDGLIMDSRRFISPGDVYLSGSGGTTTSFPTDSTSNNGNTNTNPQPVSNEPIPRFTCDAKIGDMVISVDASASSDNDGTIKTYEWDWGDGKTAVGKTITHVYSDPGEYRVTLTVTDDDNRVNSVSRTIVVPAEKANCLRDVSTTTTTPTTATTTTTTATTEPTQATETTATTEPTSSPTEPVPTPGPGLIVVLLALAGAALVLARRRD